MADEKKVKVKVIDYEAAWTTLKLAVKALELKRHKAVRLEDLKMTLKVLEEKYIKGGEIDESD